jgi:RHS repeat-associated protein
VKGIRLVAALVVMLLALGSGIAFAEQDDSAQATDPVLSSPPAADPGPEVIADRTANSQTFRLPSGELQARVYESPVNYLDNEGDWKPIDEDLEEAANGSLINADNRFELTLPQRIGSGAVRLAEDGQWVSYRLLGQASEAAEVEGNSASYEASTPGTEFDLASIATGVKEQIELSDPAQPNSFSFELDASHGLTPSLEADGSLQFRDEEGHLFSTLPPPVVSDSSPGGATSYSAVAYDLQPASEGWRLTLSVEQDWLADSERIFPVRIDPTLTLKSPSLDCSIGSLPAPDGWGKCASPGNALLYATYNQTEGQAQRSLLRFNLGLIPTNAYVSSATVSLYAPTAAENTAGVEMRRVTKPWTSALNWRRYESNPAGGLWATPGGDYTAEGADILTAQRGSQAGWWDFSSPSLREVVGKWVSSAASNQGLLVKNSNESKAECEADSSKCAPRYVAFNASTAATNKPSISVNYFQPTTGEMLSPREDETTARRLKLKAGWPGSGITGVTFQYRQFFSPPSSGEFKTIPANLIRDAQGNPVSWPLAVKGNETPTLYFDAAHATESLTSGGGKVEVRALLEGSGGGYIPSVKAIVNPTVGGPRDATTQMGPGNLDLLTGNFTVTRTDVSIAGFGSALEFARSHSSRSTATALNTGVLGAGWTPSAPVEVAGGSEWQKVSEFLASAEEKEEGLSDYAVLTDLEGYEYTFEKVGATYVSPPELSGWVLARLDSMHFALTDSDANRTIFEQGAGATDFLPVSVSQTGSGANATTMVYQPVGANRRLSMMIAPAAAGISCTELSAASTPGCRSLSFTYAPASNWGAPSGYGDRLYSVNYYGPLNATTNSQWEVARYGYDAKGRLTEEWDPRLAPPNQPKIGEAYGYRSSPATATAEGQLASITPPGQEAWTLEYAPSAGEPSDAGRLVKLKRASLLSSPAVAETTIVYDVPLSGAGAPNDMSAAAVGQWGQLDVPTDATAIFPPDQVPSSPPSSYSRASVYYLDGEGQTVNATTPSGAGTSAPSITTSEADEHGNVIRELSAQNRLRALAAGAGSVARSHELETKRNFSADGTELREEWGPMHQVRLESGSLVQARLHRSILYDQGAPVPPPDTPTPHLPTTETTGAAIVGQGTDADQRVSETKYNWTLRKPTDTIVDPAGLKLRTHIEYDPSSGLPTERRLPGEPGGGDAHTTKTIYYSAGESSDPECANNAAWANLPCKTMPAKQPGTAGLPVLPVRQANAYSPLGVPTKVTETIGSGPSAPTRIIFTSYDTAGRETSRKIEGGGASLPPSATVYDKTTGLPVEQKLTCETKCEGFDNQAIVIAYDKLGRPSEYLDADGNLSKTTYDLLGRPVSTYDGKATQTFNYDATSGLLTKLEDSAAGTFTAAYDADGNLTERSLPNGLVAKTTYDEVGAPTKLTYTKTSSCGASCTWLEEGAERSIYGQVLSQTSLSSSQQYSYDKAGRLTLVKDTPQGGSCTTRQYFFDADSNRTKLTTRAPGVSGACDTTSTGTSVSYSYDAADRLTDSEITYDNFGRITGLSGKYAGGSKLTTSFYSNEMIASQSQGGLTNSYQLDALGRPRQVTQTGTKEGTEVFHYAGGSDSPAWTAKGSTWTRNIAGIGGELAAIQPSSGETTLQLTSLHGDVVATASLSPSATKLTATFDFDEFGNPKSSGSGRFGWLGGKQRRTELPSGVIQMGVRSYVPAIGRFISTDPISGGSANAYDYANADPVNSFDPEGTRARRGLGRSQVARRATKVAPVAGAGTSVGAAPRARPTGPTRAPATAESSSSGATCSWGGTASDLRMYLPWSGAAFHAVTADVVWSCTAKVTVYAWMKVGGLPTPPQLYGNSRTGVAHITGIPYGGYNYAPLVVCVKFFYAGEGTKDCRPVKTIYES